jgi:hypothetical protein
VWNFFHQRFTSIGSVSFDYLLMHHCRSFEETTVQTAIAWNIWKLRNALVFNGVDEDL